MKNFILIVIIATLIACSEDGETSTTPLNCQQAENYNIYTGEDIGCKFYYTLTKYEGQEYIELNSYCADLSRPFVINENCVDICENLPYDNNSECGKYLAGREVIEIVLIAK